MRKLLVFIVVFSMLTVAGYAQSHDLGGRTIRIGTFTHEITPFAERGAETFLNPHGRLLGHIQMVEEMFNVKLEFVQHNWQGVLNEIAQGVLAGETDLNVYMIHRDFMVKLANDGYLWALDDFLGDYNEKAPALFQNQGHTQFKGQTYLINTQKLPPTPLGIIWNQEVFEELGLPNLYDLVESGEWTWSALLSIAEQATQDTTGDGEIDVFGIGTWSGYGPDIAITELARSNNASFTKFVDGRYVVSFLEPEFLDALQLLRDLVEVQNLPDVTMNSIHGVGRSTAAMSITAMRALGFLSLHVPEADDTLIGVVPLPKGPNSTEYVYPEWSVWGFGIPITEPQPEAVVALLNALYVLTSDYKNVSEWEDNFYENTLASWVHDRTSLEHLITGMENATIAEENWGIINTPELREAINSVLRGEQTPAVAMGQIADLVQSLLDEAYNQ